MPGGEDRHVLQQVELVSSAHEVSLYSESNADLDETIETGARMLYSKRMVEEVGAAMDEFQPNVVHLHNAYPSLGPSVHLAARKRRVPVVMTIHNMRLRCPNGIMFTEGLRCRRCESGNYLNAVVHRCFPTHRQSVGYASALWIHRFAMRLEAHVARFLAPSEFMRSRLLQWRIPGQRIRVVRHFVEASPGESRGRPFGDYGLYLGRLSPEKGLGVLLRALNDAGDPPFTIAGDGPERRALERLARQLRLSNTRFLGALPHVDAQRLLTGARYLALPSIGEEVAPLAAIEALSMGRPLLVARSGALAELVAGGAGVACRPGDVDDLRAGLVHLTQDDEQWQLASEAAQATANAFTPQHHLSELVAVYREVAPTARRSGTRTIRPIPSGEAQDGGRERPA
jgi:glycosyltransferase involved in cell wall biosynthesis